MARPPCRARRGRRGRPRPHHSLTRLSAPAEAAIEALRRQRLSGPAIARSLGRPVSTIGVVLRRRGLGRRAALDPKPPIVRYQRDHPGELIHIDVKKLGRIDRVGHRITGAALRAAHLGRPWEPAARRHQKRGRGWEVLPVGVDDASRLADTARRSGPTNEVGPWEAGALPDER